MATMTANELSYTDIATALLIAERGTESEARRAIDAADLRLLGTASFAEAAEQIGRRAGIDLIVVDTAGADEAIAGDALVQIDAIAKDRGIDLVVAMGEGQVDAVAAAVFGAHASLLCEPAMADRVAALRLAAGVRRDRLHDVGSDADARLRMLNAEVARFADTLARLAKGRDAPVPGVAREARLGYTGAPAAEAPGATDPSEVRDLIRARRMRASHFPEELFADPAWDMLLDLFAAGLEHRRVSVSSLCIAAAVPGTTALRWIGTMVEAGLFERYADPLDRRRAFVALTAEARATMQRYFDAVRRAGLAPA